MPTATTRSRRSRRTSSRPASATGTAAEKPSSPATSTSPATRPKDETTTTQPRPTHRGSRGGRSRGRKSQPEAEKPQAKPAQSAAATDEKGAKPKSPSRPTRRGSRGGQRRARSKTAANAPEDNQQGAATATTDAPGASQAKAAPARSRKTPQRTRTRSARAQIQTSPRPKIPVTGAPSDEVPEPFAHNAEYEFARILDFYGIDWQYEPRSFPLRYERGHVTEAFTPDFYLPDLSLYVELTTVKPNLTQEKNRKMRLLKEMYPEVNIMLLKKRDYLRLLAKYGYGPLKPNQVPEVSKVLFSATKVQRRVAELGAQISRDYADTQPVLVGVLRGVMCFMADLMRNISIPASVDFMATSSYDGNTAGVVRILKDLDENIKGKDVILVEDIVDTGMTLNHVIEYLQTKRPRSVKVCTLLDKRARRLVNVPLEYVGFEIPDNFVVGYGLDFRQRFRNLPFIATLKHELLP